MFYSSIGVSSEIRAIYATMVNTGGHVIRLNIGGSIRTLRVTMAHQTGDELRVLCENDDVHVTLHLPNTITKAAQATINDKRKG